MRIGHPMVDSDHAMLIDLINEAKTCAREHKLDAVSEVLARLAAYVDGHFGREESLLKEIGYPALAEHQKKHASFVGVTRKLNDAYAAAPNDAARMRAAEDIDRSLTMWLVNHILVEDMKYRPFLKGAGS